MKTINPKCTNENSFKYSILISLHYYELTNHKERTNQLNKYIDNYNFSSKTYSEFENNNPSISVSVYDENYKVIHSNTNQSTNNAFIIKMKNRYHALKPIKNKYIKLNQLLKQFTHRELTDFILRKIV